MRKQALILSLTLTLLGSAAVSAGAYDMGKAGEYVYISSGAFHTAAIDANGGLWMWGTNTRGEIGNGGAGNSKDHEGGTIQTVPVKVMDGVAAVSCGSWHTAAIKTDGTLWMWGANEYGQLGNGHVGNSERNGEPVQTVPVKVMDDVAAVSCGGDTTAAIKTDGTLWMWGDNDRGALGNDRKGNAETKYKNPFQTVPLKVMDDVAAVSCGGDTTAAVKTDGTLWMWGDSQKTVLDLEDHPTQILNDVAAVCCSQYHSAILKKDGTLWMFGRNNEGQVGSGSAEYEVRCPVQVLDDVAMVSCGGDHTAAIKNDGTLWVWGRNDDGQVGSGHLEKRELEWWETEEMDQMVPLKILDDVAAVNCGEFHTVALKTDGTLWTWGENTYGGLGNGHEGNETKYDKYIYQTFPVQISLKGGSMPKGVKAHLSGGDTAGKSVAEFPYDRNEFTIENGVLTAYMGFGGDVVVPKGVVTIGPGAFVENTSLTSVTIPAGVTRIEAYAFYGCDNLTAVTVPDSLTDIGRNAFSHCISLTAINIPEGVTKMERQVFSDCWRLSSVTIPNSVTAIETGAFSHSGLTDVTIPNSVTSIGTEAFSYCSLTSLTIPGSVTHIGERAFYSCKALDDVTILDGVTSIGAEAFSYCWWEPTITEQTDSEPIVPEPTKVTIPSSVTEIGDGAFAGCSELNEVHGSEGSYAQRWAADNKLTFVVDDSGSSDVPSGGAGTAYASTQNILVDGVSVEFQAYALKDEKGNFTNYVKLRDVASVLNGSSAQFQVGWDGAVNIQPGESYTPNGSEMHTPFSGDRAYEPAAAETKVNGAPAGLEAIVLKDDKGGAYTYYKLRDLGTALGFRVDWSAEKGIFIETK